MKQGNADAEPSEAADSSDDNSGASNQAGAEVEITVPDIGDDEVEVTEIMVSVGDSVEEEQSILNVEGDKASMEVPAPQAGKVKEIKVATGDKVKTGSLGISFLKAGGGVRLQQQIATSKKRKQTKTAAVLKLKK